MRQEYDHQAVAKSKHRNGHGHEGKSAQTLVLGRIHKQREESHVKHNRFGVEQRDDEGLAQVVARFDIEHRGCARLGQQHAATEPSQVGHAQPLHRSKGRRVGQQQRRHTGHRQPQQSLVTRDNAQRSGQPTAHAPLAGGSDQGQIPRAGND